MLSKGFDFSFLIFLVDIDISEVQQKKEITNYPHSIHTGRDMSGFESQLKVMNLQSLSLGTQHDQHLFHIVSIMAAIPCVGRQTRSYVLEIEDDAIFEPLIRVDHEVKGTTTVRMDDEFSLPITSTLTCV